MLPYFTSGNCVLRSRGAAMSKLLAEECRKRAAECAEMAEKEIDPERKREYLDLATMWRLIAQQSEDTTAV